MPLRERKKRDTRQRIVMAGLDAFTARGFENCTIDEIARAAGVGKGTVYKILGGISSLLLPIDDILPLEIRRVHIAEIFGSNFLFGVITACMLVRRTAAVVPVVAPARS